MAKKAKRSSFKKSATKVATSQKRPGINVMSEQNHTLQAPPKYVPKIPVK